MGVSERARFEVADVAATGLLEASCDAAMSLDVLVFVPDKVAAVREVARILRPQGRFAFTTWEQRGYSERLRAPQLDDHRPLLEDMGGGMSSWSREDANASRGGATAECEARIALVNRCRRHKMRGHACFLHHR
jgi:SAM-dependent methyltransferase